MGNIKSIIDFCNMFFFGYLIIYVTYLFVSNIYGSVKLYQCRKLERLHNEIEHDYYFPISIVITAFNENITILHTVSSLLNLDYKNYEIIVVDDGSTDNTKQLIIDEYDLKLEKGYPIKYHIPCQPIHEVYHGMAGNIPFTLISKQNGKCKADAANAGINVVNYPYFVCMDADEILQKDALKYAGKALFEKDNVIGVGGNLKASNNTRFKKAVPTASKMGKNNVVDMQVLEYERSFVGSRIFRNLTNSNLIISGGYGVFKKSAVIAAGGYDTKSMGEDMDLTMNLHHYFRKNKIPYSMQYAPDSVCWTQVPYNLHDLRKQRERWHCGLIQNIWKFREMILNPAYGVIGMSTIPFFIFYELLCPFFILLGWLSIGVSVAAGILDIPYAIVIFVTYLMMGTLMTLSTFLDKMFMKHDPFSFSDVMHAIKASLLDALFFRPYLFAVQFVVFFKYKKVKKKWSSPKRVAFQTE